MRGGLTTFARFSVMHGKANGPVSAGDRGVLEALRSNYDMSAHTRGDSRQAGTLTDDFIDRFAIVGPPERCIERLRSLAALGLDKVAISGGMRGAPKIASTSRRRQGAAGKEVIPGMRVPARCPGRDLVAACARRAFACPRPHAAVVELRPAVKADLAFCLADLSRCRFSPLTANWNEAEPHGHASSSRRSAMPAPPSRCMPDKDRQGLGRSPGKRAFRGAEAALRPAAASNGGLGTSFLNWMKERADRKRKDLLIEVPAEQPGAGLCERLGFKAVTTADDKVTMRY